MRRVKPLIKLFIRPLLVILAVFMAALTVSTTLARYVRGTDKVPNNFTSAGSVNPQVNDDWSITVGETGYPVYVRAVVIISWKSVENENENENENEDDVVYVKPIEGTDYEIEYNLDDWQPIENKEKNETYYYYVRTPDGTNDEDLKGIVKSEGTTTNLMTFKAKETKPPFDGYKLNVEVIVQTVQAAGKTDDDKLPAWWDAWGFTADPFPSKSNDNSGESGSG